MVARLRSNCKTPLIIRDNALRAFLPISASGQRLREVAQQILGRFQADREPDQSVPDPGALAILARHARMGSRRGSRNQGLDAAKARGRNWQMSRVDKGL